VSGEDEAGELRAGPAERAARAGHRPSAGHGPGGVLPWLVRGIERAVAYLRIAKPADEARVAIGHGDELVPVLLNFMQLACMAPLK